LDHARFYSCHVEEVVDNPVQPPHGQFHLSKRGLRSLAAPDVSGENINACLNGG
jgi:hypothetical protein